MLDIYVCMYIYIYISLAEDYSTHDFATVLVLMSWRLLQGRGATFGGPGLPARKSPLPVISLGL